MLVLLKKKENISEFNVEYLNSNIDNWKKKWDITNGGDLAQQKFVSPSKYLFLLNYGKIYEDLEVLDHVKKTLDIVSSSGLIDFVEGGFYRYTVDNEWKVPHCLEIICWTAFAINVNLWKKYVKPTDEYHFHLWAPDISMQFLSNNIYNLVLPNLYLMNKQELKKKYGINPNSAHGSKDGDEYHFGHYHPSHEAWEKRWGWKYDEPSTIPNMALAKKTAMSSPNPT